MLAHDAQQDAEDPRSDRSSPAKLRESPMHDEKYLLHDVVDGGFVDTEPSNTPPSEIDVALVKLVEGRQRERLIDRSPGVVVQNVVRSERKNEA